MLVKRTNETVAFRKLLFRHKDNCFFVKYIFQKNVGGHMSFYEATDTPALDFW